MKNLLLVSFLSVVSLFLGSTSDILINDGQNQVTELSRSYGLSFVSEVTESYVDLKYRLKFKTKSNYWTKYKVASLDLVDFVAELFSIDANSSEVVNRSKNLSKYKIYLFSSNSSPPSLHI